jgi:hypothetical protein
MPVSSSAQQFFNQITQAADPFEALLSLVKPSPPTFENEWLEFKGAEQLDLHGDKLKEIWGQALSGFANTGGGVLIFGIDASKDPESDIDCAHGLSLVSSPDKFQSRLQELHGSATEPPIQGALIKAYAGRGQSGKGFVVAYIPESPDKPHRSEHSASKGQKQTGKQFWIRAGDDFRVAGVSLLRMLFYPRSRSRVVPSLVLNPRDKKPNFTHTIDIRLSNRGTATAHDIIAFVSHKLKLLACPSWSEDSLVLLGGDPYRFELKPPVHPGIEMGLLRLGFNTTNEFQDGFQCDIAVFSKDAEPAKWYFECTCHDLGQPELRKHATRHEPILYKAEG